MARPFGTHCRRGHEFTEATTSWRRDPKTPSGWARQCKVCQADRKREAYDTQANNEKMRDYRATEAGKEATRRALKAWRSKPTGRQKTRESNARWRKAHPEEFSRYYRDYRERWQRFPSGTPADLVETARLVAQLKKELKR